MMYIAPGFTSNHCTCDSISNYLMVLIDFSGPLFLWSFSCSNLYLSCHIMFLQLVVLFVFNFDLFPISKFVFFIPWWPVAAQSAKRQPMEAHSGQWRPAAANDVLRSPTVAHCVISDHCLLQTFYHRFACLGMRFITTRPRQVWRLYARNESSNCAQKSGKLVQLMQVIWIPWE